MTYAEYLKSQGATAEEITVLVTPTAERVFTALQSQTAAAIAARDKAASDVQKMQKWFTDEATPAYQKMERELVLTKANEARARTALLSAQNQGLIDIAKDLGYTVDAPPPPAGSTPPPDLSKYVTSETLLQVAEKEGEAIALVQDIAAEHAQLFGSEPSKKLNFRQLRKEAAAAGVPFEQHWMTKYGVEAARTTRDAADKAAYESRLIAQGHAKATEEFASRYGNPDTRPLVPSQSPLAMRPNTGRDKQPWESGDMSNDRVSRATKHVVEQMTAGSTRAN